VAVEVKLHDDGRGEQVYMLRRGEKLLLLFLPGELAFEAERERD
jgi:hypothetical protein